MTEVGKRLRSGILAVRNPKTLQGQATVDQLRPLLPARTKLRPALGANDGAGDSRGSDHTPYEPRPHLVCDHTSIDPRSKSQHPRHSSGVCETCEGATSRGGQR